MKSVDKSGAVKKAAKNKKMKKNKKVAKKSATRIFLDHASTTPLDSRVLSAMTPYLKNEWGNPSALYEEGLTAKRAVAESRTSIARLLNVRSEEIVFTASGTEADNLAILGVFNYFKSDSAVSDIFLADPGPFSNEKLHNLKPHIVTTNIEHPGILEACREVEKRGGEVTYVPVEENGIVDPKKIVAALRPNTILVSVMYANNEIGTIQPLREISRVIQEFKKSQEKSGSGQEWVATDRSGEIFSGPFFHTDASQAANYLTLNFQALGVDMMTLDASKIYGPKGVGLLAVKRDVSIQPIIFGGGQEKGLRAGTENVAGIVGMSEALKIADEIREKESERLSKLRDYFFSEIEKIVPVSSKDNKDNANKDSANKSSVNKGNVKIIINGDKQKRLPNNINICVPGLDAEFAVIKLDQLGIACSSASSCLNLSENSYSYVVEALGERHRGMEGDDKKGAKKNGKETGEKRDDCRESSLRFTLGRATEKSDVDQLLKILSRVV